MTKSRKDQLIAELLNEGLADNEEELLFMLEDMGTTLEDIETHQWY
jgi:hypothetical protein